MAYDDDVIERRPDDLRRSPSASIGGALSSTQMLRDEVDRLEHTIERFLDRLAPVIKPDTERPTANPDDMTAKRADEDSELTVQLNGLGRRLSVNTDRLQRFIERVDL